MAERSGLIMVRMTGSVPIVRYCDCGERLPAGRASCKECFKKRSEEMSALTERAWMRRHNPDWTPPVVAPLPEVEIK